MSYGAGGDGSDINVREIRDPAEIQRWLDALAALPTMEPSDVRLVSFAPTATWHEIQFIRQGKVVDTRRMMGGLLDVKEHAGWAFYSGQDEEFTALVSR